MKWKNILFILACLLLGSCTDQKEMENVPVLRVSINRDLDTSSQLKVKDLIFCRLANDNQDAFFHNAPILDVVGDTIIFLDNNNASRLVMFDLKDGRYLGQVNHRGQGPGEYRMILGAFVDQRNRTVLLPDFDRPKVYVYSLANDSLANVIEHAGAMSRTEPVGGVAHGINVAYPANDGIKIMQYDASYTIADSILIPGFQDGNFTAFWGNSGVRGVFMIADTLYTIEPGRLNPVAILSRGEFALTPEQDRELIMRIMTSDESEIELLKPFILVRNVQLAYDKLLLTTMHNKMKYSDVYDLTSGKLCYRNAYSSLEKPSCIIIKGAGGHPVPVEYLFAKNGRWYGVVDEEYTVYDSGTAPDDLNRCVVSFIL